MSLSLIIRISAGYIGLWVLMMVLTPAMVASDLFGVELTETLKEQMQFTAIAAVGVGSMQWMVTSWAPEYMAKFGRLTAAFWAAFAILNVSLISSGTIIASGQNYSTSLIMVALAALLWIKSKV
ncbi:hypothetical protein ABXT70_13260 [Candidatus Njordibacter sp. Uisw_039]|jgi:hypothetical protein|uniref:hypothetical protein n=1 Tax=Candidatus Njordibacter sp. Uisw_039 TaxID=3230972 RepID=UPI003A4C20BA|tara:strand:+ start:967 stop:1338 length:372 start_codon:yes stop_codon:yes gene_type:complete